MVSCNNQSGDSSPERPVRPELRRQKNRDSFRDATSIQAQKANSKDPYAGIEVTTETLLPLDNANQGRSSMLALPSHRSTKEIIDP